MLHAQRHFKSDRAAVSSLTVADRLHLSSVEHALWQRQWKLGSDSRSASIGPSSAWKALQSLQNAKSNQGPGPTAPWQSCTRMADSHRA